MKTEKFTNQEFEEEPIVILEIPIKLVSTANTSDYWTVHYRRKEQIKKALQGAIIEKLGHNDITTPAKVVMTRIGKKLDSDNLQSAFKTVRDVMANAIIPGKRMGVTDNSTAIEWVYDQQPNQGRKDGFIVEVYRGQTLPYKEYV